MGQSGAQIAERTCVTEIYSLRQRSGTVQYSLSRSFEREASNVFRTDQVKRADRCWQPGS